jgi:hypothetical protein
MCSDLELKTEVKCTGKYVCRDLEPKTKVEDSGKCAVCPDLEPKTEVKGTGKYVFREETSLSHPLTKVSTVCKWKPVGTISYDMGLNPSTQR